MSYTDVYKRKSDQKGQTPDWLYNSIKKTFFQNKAMYDPCPINYVPNKSPDGLTTPWRCRNYVNPPFDKAGMFLRKAAQEATKGRASVVLMPTRFHTKYFKDVYENIQAIYILQTRIAFKGYSTALPVGMKLVLFGHSAIPKTPVSFDIFLFALPLPTMRVPDVIKLVKQAFDGRIAVLSNSVSVPLMKAMAAKYDAVFCPSRFDNKEILRSLKSVKKIVCFNPTLHNFMEGTMLLIFRGTFKSEHLSKPRRGYLL